MPRIEDDDDGEDVRAKLQLMHAWTHAINLHSFTFYTPGKI